MKQTKNDPTVPKDLTYGEDIRYDYALFIEDKHFPSEWEIDAKVKSFMKKETDNKEHVFYFRVIHNGEQQRGHGYIQNGEIIQWG